METQIESRKNSPWLIDQGGSSLCGVAIVGYYLARGNFDVYKNFIKDMHLKGVGTFNNTNYTIEIDSDEHLLKYKSTDSRYPTKSGSNLPIDEIDYIFMLTIKDHLNFVWDYDPDNENSGGIIEGTTGLTLPNEVEKIFKKINGYYDVNNNTNLATSKWGGASKNASELKELLNNGNNIALLINADNFQKNNKRIFTVPTHWVGLKSIIDNNANKEITVDVYTWSRKKTTWKLSYDAFEDGYFGYISGK